MGWAGLARRAAAVWALCMGLGAAADALTLSRITPSGDNVPAGRQIVLAFREPVVALGRMEREAGELPITITPALNCQWRWLDPSNLACQLDQADALKPATRYRLDIAAGPFEGQSLDAVRHEFSTQRPELSWHNFKTWRSPSLPVVRLTFNQPVTRSSVAAHVYFEAAGVRAATLASPDPDYGDTPVILPLPGEPAALVTDGAPRPTQDHPQTAGGEEARTVWLVEPSAELAPDSAVSLRLEPGLRSAEGPELSDKGRELVRFQTFGEFRFLGLVCDDLAGNRGVLLPADQAASTRCNPRASVALRFSAPVILDEIKPALRLAPDLAGGRTDYDPWANRYGWSRLSEPRQAGQTYDVELPEYLRAFTDYRLNLAASVKDEFGRALPAPVAFAFKTDHRPADLRLLYQTAVLEQDVPSDLPLVVTNLDRVDVRYTKRTIQGTTLDQQASITPPRVSDLAFFHPLGLRAMLGGGSGVVSGALASTPASSTPGIFAQVTPFEVHVKLAQYNTTVWVTEFSTGAPVGDAEIRILSGNPDSLVMNESPLAVAETDAQGLATLPGTAELDPGLDKVHSWRDSAERLMVEVRRGKAYALLPLMRDYQLEVGTVTDYQLYSYLQSRYSHLRTWGATAQGVYRLGDRVQFKFYVRDQSNRHWVPAPAGSYALKVVDPLGKAVFEQDGFRLNEFGAHDGEFDLPKTGAVGWYRFELKADYFDRTLEPLSVLVSDFTPAPFKVATRLAGERFQPGDTLTLETSASLHSGGPYADASTRQTGILRARELEPATPLARGFTFSTFDWDQEREQELFSVEGNLDKAGHLESRETLPDSPILYGTLTVESGVRDERGKTIAARADAAFASRDRFVGLKLDGWLLKEGAPATVQALVVDAAGKPVAGVPVTIRAEVEEITAARVKGAGNAYLTEYNREWKPAGQCQVTSAEDVAGCAITPAQPGSYRLIARIADTKGRSHESRIDAWAEGRGRVLFASEQNYALKLLPESEKVRVGEKARILVQNPFERATALITVERYGVLKSWVQTFENTTEVVEIPILPDYAPGFYVSVTLVSPRVAKDLSAEGVDLGKPALRMGYLQFSVPEPVKQLEVLARTDKASYKPRETVELTLKARALSGAREPVELAVAVLDEAVLDLIARGTTAYDPYQGFNRIDGLDLTNYSLLMALVGQQNFPKKGANPGGDGGPDLSLRSLFKFVSYWNPGLVTDSDGLARVRFTLPDNLTGWRVLAMAVTPNERMGLGMTRFTVNQATELRPVMPNVAREGDTFTAGFSVLNRTDHERVVPIVLEVEGPVPNGRLAQTRSLSLPAFGRGRVDFPVQTTGPGTLRFTASAGTGEERDGMRHEVPVLKRRTLKVAASYASSVDAPIEEALRIPAGIHTDVGGVSVIASPSVIGNITGAFAYLRDYPYLCWEQRLSKGVMAAQYGTLKDYLAPDFRWDEAAGLPARLMQDAAAFQAPNGGMSFFVAEDRYVSPYLSAYTALAFNWLRELGRSPVPAVSDKLDNYLANYLRRDVSPDFYTEGMTASVRAVALAALAGKGLATRDDLARYASHMPRMSLFGKAHYLQAAVDLAGPGAPEVRTTLDAILAHGDQSAGKFVLTETLDDGYARILDSGTRSHCAVLSALSHLARTPAGKALAGELPEQLVRTITAARGQSDRWENTQENLFCMQALSEYSRAYETETPALAVSARLGETVLGQGRLDGRQATPLRFEHAFTAADVGASTTLSVSREGQGRVYVATRLSYAQTQESAELVNAGMELVREYSVERDGQWRLLTSPFALKRGELVRVDLYLRLPAARNFVVVDDPIPGGLEAVNTALATASQVDAAKGAFQAAGGSFWARYGDWREYGFSFWSFYHKELRFEAARFYSEYLPAGNYHLSYVAQAVAPGDFALPAARAEEMYSPEVYGLSQPDRLEVRE